MSHDLLPLTTGDAAGWSKVMEDDSDEPVHKTIDRYHLLLDLVLCHKINK